MHRCRAKLLTMIGLLLHVLCGGPLDCSAQRLVVTGPPADPRASDSAARLLVRLYHQSFGARKEDVIWVGQNFGHTNRKIDVGYWRNVQRLIDTTGHRPAVLGVDYGFNTIGRGYAQANRYLIHHWQQCGLITISMHPRNPWRWSQVHDTRLGDLDVLLQPGTAANQRWIGILDRVADGLEQLQRADAVVLWRPFHEMNGDWFWWSGRSGGRRMSPVEFTRLWRHMFDYFTQTRHLHHLLWVYSPTAVYDNAQRPVNDYYPGDDVVDVVGLDYYGDPESHVLSQGLIELSVHGKPIVLAEFGFENSPTKQTDNRRLVNAIDRMPVRPAYVVYWHSWDNRPMAIVDHANADELVKDDR